MKRFWSKVRKAGPDECWEWTAGKIKEGYGVLRVDGKNLYAHRLAWMLTYGPIPSGLLIRHKCDNPGCCNPVHLLPGTDLDNVRDMISRGRNIKPKGEQHCRHVLTEEQVRSLRQLPAINYQEKGRELGVSGETVRSAVVGLTWKHIK